MDMQIYEYEMLNNLDMQDIYHKLEEMFSFDSYTSDSICAQLEKHLDDYNNEVQKNSAGGKVKEVKQENLRIVTGSELIEKRQECEEKKSELINEWEKLNDQVWPRYTEKVATEKGKPLRQKGMRYDIHHVIPLGMGGANTSENITPIHVLNHGEHCGRYGLHREGGPYAELRAILKNGVKI